MSAPTTLLEFIHVQRSSLVGPSKRQALDALDELCQALGACAQYITHDCRGTGYTAPELEKARAALGSLR